MSVHDGGYLNLGAYLLCYVINVGGNNIGCISEADLISGSKSSLIRDLL